jgi:hypothetical protein
VKVCVVFWVLFSPAGFFVLFMFLVLGIWRELPKALPRRDGRLGKWLRFHGGVK